VRPKRLPTRFERTPRRTLSTQRGSPMMGDVLDIEVVAAAALLASVPILEGDLNLLTVAMRRYAEVIAPLLDADLDAVSVGGPDPEEGW
jgi:hypothetical protein